MDVNTQICVEGVLCSCAHCQDKEQWDQTGTQNVSYRREGKVFYIVGDSVLEQVAERGCVVSSGDIQSPPAPPL